MEVPNVSIEKLTEMKPQKAGFHGHRSRDSTFWSREKDRSKHWLVSELDKIVLLGPVFQRWRNFPSGRLHKSRRSDAFYIIAYGTSSRRQEN